MIIAGASISAWSASEKWVGTPWLGVTLLTLAAAVALVIAIVRSRREHLAFEAVVEVACPLQLEESGNSFRFRRASRITQRSA